MATTNPECDPAAAFDQSIVDVVRTALRLTWNRPGWAIRAVRLLRHQLRAARRREESAEGNQIAPPFVIFSVTDRCNLNCQGCYANLLHRSASEEMTDERLREVLAEARDLGVSVMLLAGGEPMMRQDVLCATGAVPEILFLLFTNGSLIDEGSAGDLARRANVVPVLSQEGGACETDERRGEGMHRRVSDAMALLKARRVFFGTSTTLTSRNFETATGESTIRGMIDDGCRLFYFINYVPVEPGTDDLQLSQLQVEELGRRLMAYRKRMPALFIAFPHDEVALGGCLAAGRGFVHIDARGDVQPCPFSPFSDRNLKEMSLREALASPLLAQIRESDVRLDETDGRCALWKRRAWVESLWRQGDAEGGVAE